MCRSIKTLRPPYAEQVTDEDIRAAALQYVRKISGFRAPAGHNAEAFGHAVDAVAAATASTASSKAATLCAAGLRKPLILRTYCSAAARTSWSVTSLVNGSRRVLMLRHMSSR